MGSLRSWTCHGERCRSNKMHVLHVKALNFTVKVLGLPKPGSSLGYIRQSGGGICHVFPPNFVTTGAYPLEVGSMSRSSL